MNSEATTPLTLNNESHRYVVQTLERFAERYTDSYGFTWTEIKRRIVRSDPLDMDGIKQLLADKRKNPDTLIDYRIYMLVEVPKTDG